MCLSLFVCLSVVWPYLLSGSLPVDVSTCLSVSAGYSPFSLLLFLSITLLFYLFVFSLLINSYFVVHVRVSICFSILFRFS